MGEYISTEETKRRLNLPPESIYLGYVIYLEKTDEFLSAEIVKGGMEIRGWTEHGELSKRLTDYKKAKKLAKRNGAEVCTLWDTGTGFAVYSIED